MRESPLTAIKNMFLYLQDTQVSVFLYTSK